MGLLCWSPLGGGMLTGKYNRDQGPPKESRVGLRAEVDLPRYWNENNFRTIDEVSDVAKELEVQPVQVALGWLLHDRRVTSVIVGARTPEQLEANLAVADWDLPDSLHTRLTDIVPFPLGYPREWVDISWGNIAGDEEF